jgi:glyoxylase-like metal-dependent hydrolase (beta-lactamase superfamily II)
MANLKIGKITMGSCATNCYFVYREGEKKVLFFDPADQGEYLYQALKQKGFEVAAILLTHGHFDHIWGAQKLRELSGAKIYACREEEKLLLDAGMNVSEMAGRACTVRANAFLEDGQEMTIEGMTFCVILTPGHTGGSCCYYFAEDGILVSGDTLFQESVGRTDFPTGSFSEIVRSIKEKLFVLPDEVRVYPGHGEATSIGYEKIHNPFCV